MMYSISTHTLRTGKLGESNLQNWEGKVGIIAFKKIALQSLATWCFISSYEFCIIHTCITAETVNAARQIVIIGTAITRFGIISFAIRNLFQGTIVEEVEVLKGLRLWKSGCSVVSVSNLKILSWIANVMRKENGFGYFWYIIYTEAKGIKPNYSTKT